MSIADAAACPKCGSSWIVGEIPVADRHLFGGQTHFGRQILIERRGDDYWSSVRCPDCDEDFPR